MTTPFPFTIGQVLTAAQLNAITTLPINDQTASYVALVGDVGKRIVMNVATANTVTINDTVFATGDTIFVANKGAGESTLTAGAGVTINSASGLVLVQHQSGQLVALSASSFLFVLSAAAQQQTAIFNETQAQGTQGGASSAASIVKRTLNTTVVNTITGCTLTSSVIALPAGTYRVEAFAPAHQVNANKIRFQNTTDSSTTILGTNNSCGAIDASPKAHLLGVFTIAATKNFEVQHIIETAVVTNGLGQRNNQSGISEIYTVVEIVKLS